LADKAQRYYEGEPYDPRCCIPSSLNYDDTKSMIGGINDKQLKDIRLKRYLVKVLDSLNSGAERNNTVNAFVYRAMNDIQADYVDIKKALDIIFSLPVFDMTFPDKEKQTFYKRIKK